MKQLSSLFFLFFIVLQVLAQKEIENKATNQQFSLNPNDIGALSNSVNLMTGQAGFPMTLAALQGRGGLNPQVVINYSTAGVEQQVKTWNRDYPTGTLGLGWSFEFPKIVSNFRGTATRHDDTYYLVDGGTSQELICTNADIDESLGYRTYETKNYTNWKVEYHYEDERWDVIMDDGMIYRYGDGLRDGDEGTIQYMIKWGNWIGDSNNTTGASMHAYTWNLSEIENLWGDRMTYYYDNVEEYLPSSPIRHTRASVLSRIEGPTGNHIDLTYGEKVYEPCTGGGFRCTDSDREYQDPHVEAAEPDAYQEKYETRYLQSVTTYNEADELLYTVDLTYDRDQWIGEGELVKRVLTSIQKTTPDGGVIPPTQFTYYRNISLSPTTEGITYSNLEIERPWNGYLESVGNSIGGVVSYSYKQTGSETVTTGGDLLGGPMLTLQVSTGDRDLKIEAPEDYEAPSIFWGPDYVAVIWRNAYYYDAHPLVGDVYLNDYVPTVLHIYQWEGEWVLYDMGSLIGNVATHKDWNRLGLLASMQQDHFAFAFRNSADKFEINLFHKNPTGKGWLHDRVNGLAFDYSDHFLVETTLMSGKDYVAVGNNSDSYLYIYDWDGKEWNSTFSEDFLQGDHSFTGSDNYIIVHNNDAKPEPEAEGKDMIWMIYKTEDGEWMNLGNDGLDGLLPASTRFRSTWSKDDPDGNDLSYWYGAPSYAFAMADGNAKKMYRWDENFDNITVADAIGSEKDSYPVQVTSNVVAIEEKSRQIALRIDGVSNNINYVNGLSETPEIPEYRLAGDSWLTTNGRTYPTNTYPTFLDIIIMDQLYDYDANTGNWELELEVPWGGNFQLMPGTAVMDDNIYFREPDGTWIDIGNVSMENFDHQFADMTVSSGLIFNTIPFTETEIHWINNGEEVELDDINKRMDWRNKYYGDIKNLAGPGMFVAFNTSVEKYKADEMYLYKFSDGNYEGGHEAVVVSSIHVNDGYLNLPKTFDYDELTARMSVNGAYPLFNQVKVINGSSDEEEYDQGYTLTYFYNGKSIEELNHVPDEQSGSFANLLLGATYRTEQYDSENELVSASETVYKLVDKNTHPGIFSPLRPEIAYSYSYEKSGVTSSKTVTSYNTSFVLPESVTNYNDADETKSTLETVTSYDYISEAYGGIVEDHHILSQPISVKQSINGELISHSATVWDDSGTPYPAMSYGHRGTPEVTFPSYDGGDPGAGWRLSSKVTAIDGYGNVLETEDYRGNKQVMLYDTRAKLKVLTGAYAERDQMCFTSFERWQNAGWSYSDASVDVTDGYTGPSSCTGTVTSATLPTGEYILSYWYKNGDATVTIASGSGTIAEAHDIREGKGWTLQKVRLTLTSAGTISLAPSGKVDQVLIHPEAADVSTMVYDHRDRVVAESSPSLQTIHYEYDELDRQQYMTDEAGNIITHYTYGFKTSILQND